MKSKENHEDPCHSINATIQKGCISRFTPATFEITRQHITLTHGTSWGSYYWHKNMGGSNYN
jgi:hypothetical protein